VGEDVRGREREGEGGRGEGKMWGRGQQRKTEREESSARSGVYKVQTHFYSSFFNRFALI
jgi:hypothetical protein